MLEVNYPMENGMVRNWEDMVIIILIISLNYKALDFLQKS